MATAFPNGLSMAAMLSVPVSEIVAPEADEPDAVIHLLDAGEHGRDIDLSPVHADATAGGEPMTTAGKKGGIRCCTILVLSSPACSILRHTLDHPPWSRALLLTQGSYQVRAVETCNRLPRPCPLPQR